MGGLVHYVRYCVPGEGIIEDSSSVSVCRILLRNPCLFMAFVYAFHHGSQVPCYKFFILDPDTNLLQQTRDSLVWFLFLVLNTEILD